VIKHHMLQLRLLFLIFVSIIIEFGSVSEQAEFKFNILVISQEKKQCNKLATFGKYKNSKTEF